jgi:hypothetical protein
LHIFKVRNKEFTVITKVWMEKRVRKNGYSTTGIQGPFTQDLGKILSGKSR